MLGQVMIFCYLQENPADPLCKTATMFDRKYLWEIKNSIADDNRIIGEILCIDMKGILSRSRQSILVVNVFFVERGRWKNWRVRIVSLFVRRSIEIDNVIWLICCHIPRLQVKSALKPLPSYCETSNFSEAKLPSQANQSQSRRRAVNNYPLIANNFIDKNNNCTAGLLSVSQGKSHLKGKLMSPLFHGCFMFVASEIGIRVTH